MMECRQKAARKAYPTEHGAVARRLDSRIRQNEQTIVERKFFPKFAQSQAQAPATNLPWALASRNVVDATNASVALVHLSLQSTRVALLEAALDHQAVNHVARHLMLLAAHFELV